MNRNVDFEERRKIALQMLAASPYAGLLGYRPFAFTFLWYFGVKITPPHFATFSSNLLVFTIWFSVSGGLLLTVQEVLLTHKLPVEIPLVFIGLFGASFGALFAVYYKISAKSLQLPRWESL